MCIFTYNIKTNIMTITEKEYLLFLQNTRNHFYNTNNIIGYEKVQKDIDKLTTKTNKMMQAKTQKLLGKLLLLPEYQRKQVISCLIASMLSEVSHNKAKETYDNVIKELQF